MGLAVVIALAIGISDRVRAAIIVDGVGDTVAADGVCTLREAIQAANSGSTVNECDVSGGSDTIMITVGPIVLESALPSLSSMTLQGGGHEVSGNELTRVFQIASGAQVTIEDIAIINGNAGGGLGGGILVNNNSQLTLNRCLVANNQAHAGGGLRSIGAGAVVEITECTFQGNQTPNEGGGAINNDLNSTMTITRSSIVGNSGRYAGGIANYNGAVMTVRNSTVSGNSCTDAQSGGGVENYDGGATLTIENSTITGNSCGGNGSAGGIFNNTNAPILVNSIVAGNTAARPDLSGSFTSGGHNLIGDATGSSGFSDGVNGDQVGSSASPIDPLLDALANNGGPTFTHALLPGSPAIDSGDNSVAPATDQRGSGFPRILNGGIDIGSFESCRANNTVTSVADGGDGSLRQAVEGICENGYIDFEAGLAGQSIELTSGQVSLNKSLTITNPLAPGLAVDGQGNSRVFNIIGGAQVTIEDIAIINGNAGGGLGGGILVNNNSQLTLNRCLVANNQAHAGGGLRSIGAGAVVEITECTFQGNQTPNEGGGAINNDLNSTMTITRSSIVGNSGRYAGGIANYNGAVMTVRNSTVSGNSCTDAQSGGGVENYDGGATLTIENSTITGNSCGGNGSAGGIFNNTNAPILVNSIVAGNTAARPDLSGSFTSGGHNLIGDATGSSGFSDGVNGDQVGSSASPIDPLLDALTDNGGPTFTHALLPGSPAIDSGDNAVAPATDQRGSGFPRIVHGTIDIGAFELCEPLPLITSSIGSGLGSVSPESESVDCGATVVFTLIPDVGYSVDVAGGTCPGSLSGDEFTTEPITENCEIVAHFSQDPIDGLCGAADGGIFTTAPTESLCDAGDASAVTGDGPWMWTCQGIAGGADASCSADIQHYSLNYSAGTGGSIFGPISQSVPHGGSGEEVTALADTGYSFVQWSDGDESNPRTDKNVVANLDVEAAFVEHTITTLSSNASPAFVNEPAAYLIEVYGTVSAPGDGQVLVEVSTGESCTATTASVTGSVAIFQCDISFASAGSRTASATFSGASTHQNSESNLIVQQVVEDEDIFSDRFEAK
jgi:CSLREA domain-containing protein